MKYIIMADGKGTRWGDSLGTPKHLVEIEGERLLDRTVRQLRERGAEDIVITSHNPLYQVEGAVRHEPLNNVIEVDRFTAELIDDDVCFLYGDTCYSEKAMDTIVRTECENILFFGSRASIVAVKVADGDLFRKNVENVRRLFLEGKIDKCIGWQVYQSYAGLPYGEKVIGGHYVLMEGQTVNINRIDDFRELAEKMDEFRKNDHI